MNFPGLSFLRPDAAMNKETLPMIGRLLGHANHQSTARYAHLDDEHLLDAVQQVGDAVERLLGGSLFMLR